MMLRGRSRKEEEAARRGGPADRAMKKKKENLFIRIIRWSIPFLFILFWLCFRFSHFRWQILAMLLSAAVSFFLFCPKRRIVRSGAAALAVFIPLFLFTGLYYSAGYGIRHSQYRSHELDRNVFRGKKILVMIPHQDDEINLFGGLFEIFEKDSDVYVMYSTNGDWMVDADTRIREAVNALDRMGVDRDHIIFLGYGDNCVKKDGTHIYNLPGDEVFVSSEGCAETYASYGFEPYRHSAYTRDNMKSDIAALLLELRPEVVFCIDYDYHHDHRALSLLFEEAMGEILGRVGNDYVPTVFKGFAYSTAFSGEPDFYAENIRSTVPFCPDYPFPGNFYTDAQGSRVFHMGENNIYLWDDRVRFPVADNNLSRTLRSNNLYWAMICHESQELRYSAMSTLPAIINGDKVFWLRDTSGLLYGAEVSVSSGDGGVLTDFKLTDSPDVYDKKLKPFANLWSPEPEDGEKTAAFTFRGETKIDSVRLYDNPSLSDNILRGRIDFPDGTGLEFGPLAINGSATVIAFEEKAVSSFTVRILETEGEAPGLSEAEAYYRYDPAGTVPKIIKLQDQNGDFVYDYRMNGRSAVFSVYDSRSSFRADGPEEEYTLKVLSGNCTAEKNGDGTFTVTCGKGCSAELALYAGGEETPADLVTVRNPLLIERLWYSLLTETEKQFYLYSPAEQYGYIMEIVTDYRGKLHI